jgi:8-oxo-dGTP pyrophosphatase MutT (NUDIX family)
MIMKEEVSAGGVVYRRITNVIPAKAGIQEKSGSRIKSGMTNVEVLISQHSGHHGWVFPKGHVGDHDSSETKEEAALREVKEETGITGKILQSLSPIDYWYAFGGEKRHKTVWYYVMEYVSGDIKDHDWEMENVEWSPIDEVDKRLTYPGDKKAWKEAKGLIDHLLLTINDRREQIQP